MISSKVIDVLTPLFNIVTNAKGKTIRQIKEALLIGDKCRMKKGASGLIVENLLTRVRDKKCYKKVEPTA